MKLINCAHVIFEINNFVDSYVLIQDCTYYGEQFTMQVIDINLLNSFCERLVFIFINVYLSFNRLNRINQQCFFKIFSREDNTFTHGGIILF